MVLLGGFGGGGKEGGSKGRREDLKLIPHSYLDSEGLSGHVYNLPGATLMMAPPPFLWTTRSSLPPHPALSFLSRTLQL